MNPPNIRAPLSVGDLRLPKTTTKKATQPTKQHVQRHSPRPHSHSSRKLLTNMTTTSTPTKPSHNPPTLGKLHTVHPNLLYLATLPRDVRAAQEVLLTWTYIAAAPQDVVCGLCQHRSHADPDTRFWWCPRRVCTYRTWHDSCLNQMFDIEIQNGRVHAFGCPGCGTGCYLRSERAQLLEGGQGQGQKLKQEPRQGNVDVDPMNGSTALIQSELLNDELFNNAHLNSALLTKELFGKGSLSEKPDLHAGTVQEKEIEKQDLWGDGKDSAVKDRA
ncbi:uncharacterized protein BP01DRAFT_378409 [Aspergillus saccharolyticus JOP 1030-1]|uniref:Uncharacterized protein n=1 Tax=Aspergillus saccharolyticus JOP 1030-1 TaxID=1450539 RepID=A0A318ZQB0_9EURO|nr:hypothetical protein BP01DRAFT_378409 [Aspergillus saccharolyticus JOP 1030-1]PYH49799.1 hypothetical protein BP01DRAFT_378409 [Aspergillus saccharolyticus JOP 1030-1]